MAAETCLRCGHRCPHVEVDMGHSFCPNCGDPIPLPGETTRVTYGGWGGCDACQIPGRSCVG